MTPLGGAAGRAETKARCSSPVAEAEHRAGLSRVSNTFGTELSHQLVRPLVLRPRITPGVLYRVNVCFCIHRTGRQLLLGQVPDLKMRWAVHLPARASQWSQRESGVEM